MAEGCRRTVAERARARAAGAVTSPATERDARSRLIRATAGVAGRQLTGRGTTGKGYVIHRNRRVILQPSRTAAAPDQLHGIDSVPAAGWPVRVPPGETIQPLVWLTIE